MVFIPLWSHEWPQLDSTGHDQHSLDQTVRPCPEFTGRIRNLLFDCISVAWAQVELFQNLFNRVRSLFSGILSVYIELSAFIVNHNESVAVTTKKVK